MTSSPSTSKASSSNHHWSEFWRHGSLTTFFAGDFQRGYDGPVAAFWEKVFADLPVEATIVDLATGNGAIPYLAVGAAEQKHARWRIIGVDYAEIGRFDDPAVQARMASVELMSNTPMEHTGLADSSVDLVTSHFGIEYGDRSAVIDELDRLLAEQGRLALVLHHPASAVVQQAKRDFQQTRMCLEEERLDRKVSRLVKLVGHATTPAQRANLRRDPEAERLRHQINRSMERLMKRVQGQDDSQMFRVAQSFLRVFADLIDRPLQEKLDFIRQSSQSLSAYAGRMESMARATLSDSEHEGFVAALQAIGLEIEDSAALVTDSGELLGRTLLAKRL